MALAYRFSVKLKFEQRQRAGWVRPRPNPRRHRVISPNHESLPVLAEFWRLWHDKTPLIICRFHFGYSKGPGHERLLSAFITPPLGGQKSPLGFYCIPRSVSTLGFLSSTASRLWQTLQSFVSVFPLFDTWFPSWQRKHPGKSL